MKNYDALLRDVGVNGEFRMDRTGTGALSVFGRSLNYDLSAGFPLLTTKKVHFKSVAYELLWFLRGDNYATWLEKHGVTIWKEWGDPETRYMGPIYGVQWRQWYSHSRHEYIDQIGRVIEEIKRNPASRRLIVSAWNVGDLDQMALPPCHMMFQFFVSLEKKTLSCVVYQRSADLFLGIPFNIASYALLTHMVAHVCGLGVGELTLVLGDAHLYVNHAGQVNELLTREHRELPNLNINRTVTDIDDFKYCDFDLIGYDPHPPIKAPVAV